MFFFICSYFNFKHVNLTTIGILKNEKSNGIFYLFQIKNKVLEGSKINFIKTL